MVKKHNNKGKKGNFKKKAIATTLVGFLGAASPAYALPVNSNPVPEKNKSKVSMTLEANKGSGSYGAGLGVRFGNIGLGVKGKKYSDRNLYETEENVFGDVYFKGKKDLEKISYIGAFAEFYPRISEKVSMVLGAGGGLKKGTINIEEKLLRGEKELASHETSTSKKGFGWDIYAGLIFDIKKLGIGPIFGYEKSSGENGLNKGSFYFGIKANFKIK